MFNLVNFELDTLQFLKIKPTTISFENKTNKKAFQ